ncbi:hypothetical protein HIN52_23355, partial [Salmonella enterica subsp. enterica serovar Typhimurium]|nr:hypothetical protein [Salmonella enterica subsp. enterica serovar Typhimurium]
MSRDYYWNNHGEVGTIDDGLRGSVVYSYDRSGYLTGRSGQMYDHDRYYYDKAGNLLDNEGQGAVMSNRQPQRLVKVRPAVADVRRILSKPPDIPRPHQRSVRRRHLLRR